jgi:hypothetical protein
MSQTNLRTLDSTVEALEGVHVAAASVGGTTTQRSKRRKDIVAKE